MFFPIFRTPSIWRTSSIYRAINCQEGNHSNTWKLSKFFGKIIRLFGKVIMTFEAWKSDNKLIRLTNYYETTRRWIWLGLMDCCGGCCEVGLASLDTVDTSILVLAFKLLFEKILPPKPRFSVSNEALTFTRRFPYKKKTIIINIPLLSLSTISLSTICFDFVVDRRDSSMRLSGTWNRPSPIVISRVVKQQHCAAIFTWSLILFLSTGCTKRGGKKEGAAIVATLCKFILFHELWSTT